MLYPIEHWFLASFLSFLFIVIWIIIYRWRLAKVLKFELLQDNYVSLPVRITITVVTYMLMFLTINFIGYLLVIFGVNLKQILY